MSELPKISPRRKATTKLRYNSTFSVAEFKELSKKGKVKSSKDERAKWKAKADKWFSEWIRLRDAGPDGRVKCCTCSHTNHWRYLQCGHFVTRGHQSTRFDEQNCNTQCRGCNYNGGQHLKHATFIDGKYGAGTAAKIEEKGRRRCNRTAFDFKFLADTYKARVQHIKEQEPLRYGK
jgi:hypothetical protein